LPFINQKAMPIRNALFPQAFAHKRVGQSFADVAA
jgi:hypothetical protein